jgi:predicted glycosyl hydrolase (DUF1957 family)
MSGFFYLKKMENEEFKKLEFTNILIKEGYVDDFFALTDRIPNDEQLRRYMREQAMAKTIRDIIKTEYLDWQEIEDNNSITYKLKGIYFK